MCTIALAWRIFDRAPIVVGANREEQFDRPATAPQQVGEGKFAPLDLVARGTWIGVTAAGLFAAITNRRGGPTGSQSRGLLLRDALDCTTASEARDAVRSELDTREYAGCNIVFADANDGYVIEWDGTIQCTALAPGLHVILNRGLHTTSAKGSVIQSRLQAATEEGATVLTTRLQAVLADHGVRACVHGKNRGTRSSSIIQFQADGPTRWSFADGPPCQTTYRPVLEGEL